MVSSESKAQPRILFVDGNPLQRNGNVGILKSNLFSLWTVDNLAQITTSGIRVDERSLGRQFILKKSLIIKNVGGYEYVPTHIEPLKIKQSKSSTLRSTLKKSFRALSWLNVLSSHIIRSLFKVDGERIKNFMEDFKPEVIVTFGYTLPEIKIAYQLSEYYKLPLIMYITDDYISWAYKTNKLQSLILRKEMEVYFELCLNKASHRFVVSDGMNIEYTRRYSLDFITVNDGIDLLNYRDYIARDSNTRDKLDFYYIGGFMPGRLDSLLLFCCALNEINNKKAAIPYLRLIIHTFEGDSVKYDYIFEKYDFVQFREQLGYDEVADVQMKSDVLLHVESFDKQVADTMTRYSMSTKLFQYTAASRPILAIGPDYLESIRFLRENQLGYVISVDDISILNERITMFVKDYNKYSRESRRNIQFASDNFDRDGQSGIIMNYINEIKARSY